MSGRIRPASGALPGLALALLLPVLSLSQPAHAQMATAAPAATEAQARPSGPRLGAEAARIEALIASGHGTEAVAAARAFLRQVTEAVGFGVTNPRLTVAPAEGFGMFVPRPDNHFRTDEPVYAYVEVYGFSMSPLTTGANRLLFDVSFTLETPDGRQMTDAMIPMGEVQLDSYSQPVDGFFHLTYRVTGAEGAYVLHTRVVDRASGQTAEFRLPVVFENPENASMSGK